MKERTDRLGRTDWMHAALAAIAEGGLRAVAVEPLAERLGVTKGSFYWHFENRNDLLVSTLEYWEKRWTDDGLERLDRIGDPRRRRSAAAGLYNVGGEPMARQHRSEVSSSGVTGLLEAWAAGDAGALDELWSRLYRELRRLAGGYLRAERSDHTLEATDLVHEAYVRLVGPGRIGARRREQFFALAARTMRHVLVDHARRKLAGKRGGGARRVSLDHLPHLAIGDSEEILALDEALTELAEVDADLARLVELRFFGGLRSDEIAGNLQISVPTVTRRWRAARAWLYKALAAEAV